MPDDVFLRLEGISKAFAIPAGNAGVQYAISFLHRYAVEAGFDTCWVETSFDVAQEAACLAAGFVGGHAAVLANGKPSGPPLTIAILDQKGLRATRLYAKAEAPQFVVPINFFLAVAPDHVDGPLRELHPWAVRVSMG